MELQRHHTDGSGEFNNLRIDFGICTGMAHDFAGIILPDGVRKMERAVLRRASGMFREHAGKQSRGIGNEDCILIKQISELRIDILLCLGIFRHGFDDDICVLNGSFPVEFDMNPVCQILLSCFEQFIDGFHCSVIPAADQTSRIHEGTHGIADKRLGCCEIFQHQSGIPFDFRCGTAD